LLARQRIKGASGLLEKSKDLRPDFEGQLRDSTTLLIGGRYRKIGLHLRRLMIYSSGSCDDDERNSSNRLIQDVRAKKEGTDQRDLCVSPFRTRPCDEPFRPGTSALLT
jgi:hypothetical protein